MDRNEPTADFGNPDSEQPKFIKNPLKNSGVNKGKKSTLAPPPK